MDDIHNVVTSNTPAAPRKQRLHIPKLSPEELAAFTGIDMTHVNEANAEYTNYLVFNTPLTGTLGSPTEAGHCFDFAYQLEAEAKAKALGSVTSVGVSNGIFDVKLKMEAGGSPEKQSAPAAEAYVKLKDFLGKATQLKQGPAGKRASCKIMVNGTTRGIIHF